MTKKTSTEVTKEVTKIKSRITGELFHGIHTHLKEHNMTLEQYLEQYPDAPVVSQAMYDYMLSKIPGAERKSIGLSKDTKIQFGPIMKEVNLDVDPKDCLMIPHRYKEPQFGRLKEDFEHATIALNNNRSLYIWGMQGCGKDALFHAWSGIFRIPALRIQITPDDDLHHWFYTRGFDQEGTKWEEGALLKALRDGYTTSTGRKIPYLILVSDFDRAGKTQAETLRSILDSIEGFFTGPMGITYKVFPGTQFVFTANTSGSGDSRGRNISANPMDSSLMDRIERKFQFHWMDWRDEVVICKRKFQDLYKKRSDLFRIMGKCTNSLRTAIEEETLYAEFSHRAICSWLGHAEDYLAMNPEISTEDLLRATVRVYLDGLPDSDTQEQALSTIDAHLKGGALDEGDTSHIDDDPLHRDFDLNSPTPNSAQNP